VRRENFSASHNFTPFASLFSSTTAHHRFCHPISSLFYDVNGREKKKNFTSMRREARVGENEDSMMLYHHQARDAFIVRARVRSRMDGAVKKFSDAIVWKLIMQIHRESRLLLN
jgi:hypothetical protein